jgi:hypothetical protein
LLSADVGDLKISDVPLLLNEYKRLATALESLGAFDRGRS